jgi:enoyl-CoA hydratase/carnithine racemase
MIADHVTRTITLNRPDGRNALSMSVIAQLRERFDALPDTVRVAILCGKGTHVSAGLDLSELSESTSAEGLQHSFAWYEAFSRIQFGRVPGGLRAAGRGGGRRAGALRIAGNAPLAILKALPLIAEQPMSHGLMTEALMAAITQGAPEAKERINAFLDKRANKVGPA